MQTIFVMVKCELGKAYEVADDAVAVEQVSEVYSTSGQYDLLMKCYLDEKTDIGHFVTSRIQDAAGREGHLHPDHLQGVFLSTALPQRHLAEGRGLPAPPPVHPALRLSQRRSPVLRSSRDRQGGPNLPRDLPRGSEIAPVSMPPPAVSTTSPPSWTRNVIAGILVIHRGRIVLERYGLRPAVSIDRWSTHVDRQVDDAAMLAGAAGHDGAIKSIDDLG